jgi:antitoxin (DNA-binding transcriptional repressor) of toxin-antitoxin stability system
MKTIEVGAFEAKTQLSKLLREVEKGVTVHITHRGRPIAVLKQEEKACRDDPIAAMKRLRKYRRNYSIDEINALRESGRER